MDQVRIVNADSKPIAILENAHRVGYEKSVNRLWTAWFSMPADDSKVEYCKPLSFVEIWEKGERVELFRIVPSEIDKSDTAVIHYTCEHVLATLMDDVMFQYHEFGGTGVFTASTINYILSQQSTNRWALEECQFNRQFLYKWENENLLGSMFSIPKRFMEPYHWTYDTTVFPWKISLEKVSDIPQSYIRYRKNLVGIRKKVDASQLCTRIYPLGYGEGVNQLDIKSVNSGVPYLDASTKTKYGIISRVWVDRRYEDALSLRQTAQAMLADLKEPYVTYEVEAADISEITSDPVDKFQLGTYTRVIDEEINEDTKALILSVRKNDLGDPESTVVEVANRPLDVAQTISDLADRQRINEVYAQGATNLDSKDFVDNCDSDYPATIEFYIPQETVRINKMVLNMRTERFRAYSRAILGGGGTTATSSSGGGTSTSTASGGGTTATSSSGGGTSTTSGAGGGTSTTSSSGGGTSTSSGAGGASTQTSSSGGGTSKSSGAGGASTQTSSSGGGTSTSSGAGGASTQTSSSGGGTATSTSSGGGTATSTASGGGTSTTSGSGASDVWISSTSTSNFIFDTTTDADGHFHGVYGHTHNMSTGNHTHSISVPSHTHSISIPNHQHSVSIGDHTHSISIPNHQHSVSIGDHTHSITIPTHTHSISIDNHTHSVSIPNHTHSVTIGNHTHSITIPTHTHSISIDNHTHSVSIPNHTHSVTIGNHTHTVSIPNHTHNIQYGIFESSVLPSTVQIRVDGNLVPGTGLNRSDLDIVPYLSKDGGGRVTRGWHKITATPNNLARIVMSLTTQVFVQSRGGGDF